jgi:hypothetical protein
MSAKIPSSHSIGKNDVKEQVWSKIKENGQIIMFFRTKIFIFSNLFKYLHFNIDKIKKRSSRWLEN